MTNLEKMEQGVSYTYTAYCNAYNSSTSDKLLLSEQAEYYSAMTLNHLLSVSNYMSNDYTRRDNIRYNMASVGAIGIKNELLKNVINVACLNREKETKSSKQLSYNIDFDNMTADDISVVLLNNISQFGIDRGYELLNDPNILMTAAILFTHYRLSDEKKHLDRIADTNNIAKYFNGESDVYYSQNCEIVKSENFGYK